MIAAFFDIDGTLYRNGLLIEHFKKLIKYEIIDEMVWFEKVRTPFQEWAIRKGDYEHYLEEVSSAYKDSMIGLDEKTIEFIAETVIQQQWEKTYVFTRDRIRWHLDQGHYVFFISGSPDFLVSKMAEHYGITDFRASTYVYDAERRFTGEVLPMWDAANKRIAINQYVQQYALELDRCYAYGDTGGDLTMLQMVGHPVAINPNRNLLRAIFANEELKQRISIVVERKDMIYRITPECVDLEGLK